MNSLKQILLLIAVFYIVSGCENETKSEETSLKSDNTNEAEITNTINNVYNNIIVNPNQKPDFTKIKEQFAESARLGYIRKDSLILKSPNQYFDNMENMLSKNEVKYLKEWEIRGETKFFGNIAQRTSLYGVHFNATDSLAEKGIINFQLVKINNEWKIISMIWQAENQELKISDNYWD